MQYRSEQDGLIYVTVICANCGGLVSNQADETIYDEQLDVYFCGSSCQKEKHQETNEEENEITDDITN